MMVGTPTRGPAAEKGAESDADTGNAAEAPVEARREATLKFRSRWDPNFTWGPADHRAAAVGRDSSTNQMLLVAAFLTEDKTF